MMDEKLFGTRLYVSFNRLKNNINTLKKHVPVSMIIAMVKANAYGHGDIRVSKKLMDFGVSNFGVADFEEGLRLRKHGINVPIIVMNPGLNNLETIIQNGLEPVLYNMSMLSRLGIIINKSQQQFLEPIQIHIKINTGMNRWGFNISDFSNLIEKLKSIQNIKIKSIYSHLSSGGCVKEKGFTKNQVNLFNKLCEKFCKNFSYPILTHLSSSSTILENTELLEPSRIGILLYGGIHAPGFQPVSQLKCSISDIKMVKSGDSIGYERHFIANKNMKIGVLPFGYADGLQRNWGNGVLKFAHKNRLIPTVGHISMDSCMVDLSSIRDISIGDDIIYFGDDRPIWDLANDLNTIPYEIMSTLSRRIKRVYN